MKFQQRKNSQELYSMSSGGREIHYSDVEGREEGATFGSCLTES